MKYDAIYFNLEKNQIGLLDIESTPLLKNILESDYRSFIFKKETRPGERSVT